MKTDNQNKGLEQFGKPMQTPQGTPIVATTVVDTSVGPIKLAEPVIETNMKLVSPTEAYKVKPASEKNKERIGELLSSLNLGGSGSNNSPISPEVIEREINQKLQSGEIDEISDLRKLDMKKKKRRQIVATEEVQSAQSANIPPVNQPAMMLAGSTTIHNKNGNTTVSSVDILTDEQKKQLEIRGLAEKIVAKKPDKEFADSNCPFCKGKGIVQDNLLGYYTCDCVKRNRQMSYESEIAALAAKARKEEQIKALHSESLEDRLWLKGLVHPEMINHIFYANRLTEQLSQYKDKGKVARRASIDRVAQKVNEVLGDITTGKKITQSQAIYVPFWDINVDIAIHIMKAALLTGRTVVPYISVLQLAPLKASYILDTQIVKGHGYLTTEEQKVLSMLSEYEVADYKQAKMELSKTETIQSKLFSKERRTLQNFMKMSDEDKEAYKNAKTDRAKELAYNTSRQFYSFLDYIEADIVVVLLSSKRDSACREVDLLKTLLEERSLQCKPTIILTARDFLDSRVKGSTESDYYLMNDIITEYPGAASYRVPLYTRIEIGRGKTVAETTKGAKITGSGTQVVQKGKTINPDSTSALDDEDVPW